MAASFNENVCHNKLLFEPRDASLLDLIRLLIFPDIKSRRFVNCPEGQKPLPRDFNTRWLIFVTVLLQKILLLLRIPLALLGCAIEIGLNLLSNNGGFFKLVWTIFTGKKVIWPKRSSATFASAIGHIDKRVDLDKNIRPGHIKYNASLSWMAAKLSYENKAFIESTVKNYWNMEFVDFNNYWNDYLEQSATQAFMLQDRKDDPNLIVVAFRGTSPFNSYDWCSDVDLSWYDMKDFGKIHRGFMKALGLQKDGWPVEINQDSSTGRLYAYYVIRQKLRELLSKNKNAKFIVTGHSLGGALAILFAGVLAFHEEILLLDRLEGVYTFGQPRVGDKEFVKFMVDKMEKYNIRYSRYVYCNDMVPRLPYDGKILLFKHIAPCIYHNNIYKGQVMEEEPNKNYFSLFWAIPKSINAIWELIRGSILPTVEGQEYKEGWFLKLFRTIGLLIPGISAHGPQDYNNSLRLGSLSVSPQPQYAEDLE